MARTFQGKNGGPVGVPGNDGGCWKMGGSEVVGGGRRLTGRSGKEGRGGVREGEVGGGGERKGGETRRITLS